MFINKRYYACLEYDSRFTVTKLSYHLIEFSVFFKFFKSFTLLVCQPHNILIFIFYNLPKSANYFCSFVSLFNFLSFILQIFVFMQFSIDDRFEKLFPYLFFQFSRVNVCFWNVLQILKLNNKFMVKKLPVKLYTAI